MTHRRAALLAWLQTPLGRRLLLARMRARCWPAYRRLATAHRATLGRRARVVVVVGSLGKTTTAHAVTAALGARSHPRMAYNTYVGVAAALLRIRRADRHAVVEVGIGGPGSMGFYARFLRPDVAVVTSVASEHNRSFETLEATRDEKAEMVRVLPPTGVAVLNGDDPHVRWMAGRTRARVVTFGFERGNDVRATEVALDWPAGTRFLLHAGGVATPARIRLLGRPGVRAALAAVAVARSEGIALDAVLGALETLPPVSGRLEPVRLGNGAMLLRDDSKSAVETIDAALDLLAEVPARQRIVVLGNVTEPAPGTQGPTYRRLGERIGGIATRAVFVGDRSQAYSAGARRAGMAREALVNVSTRVLEAAEHVRGELGPGDVVLVKGRDTQRLDRVSLALAGRSVRCALPSCGIKGIRCDTCPMLERGWRDGARLPPGVAPSALSTEAAGQ